MRSLQLNWVLFATKVSPSLHLLLSSIPPKSLICNRSSRYEMPEGLIAVAKKNSEGRFLLASRQNYFEGHKVEAVMIDRRYSLLLPILEGELQSLMKKFPFIKYTWQIKNDSSIYPSFARGDVQSKWSCARI